MIRFQHDSSNHILLISFLADFCKKKYLLISITVWPLLWRAAESSNLLTSRFYLLLRLSVHSFFLFLSKWEKQRGWRNEFRKLSCWNRRSRLFLRRGRVFPRRSWPFLRSAQARSRNQATQIIAEARQTKMSRLNRTTRIETQVCY